MKENHIKEKTDQIINTDHNKVEIVEIKEEPKEIIMETNTNEENSHMDENVNVEERKNDNNKGSNYHYDVDQVKKENILKISPEKINGSNVKINKNHQRNRSVQNSTLYTLLGLQTRNK